MTDPCQFKQKMIEDLQLRRDARSTCGQYVACARSFVAYHVRPPPQLDERRAAAGMMYPAMVHTSTRAPHSMADPRAMHER